MPRVLPLPAWSLAVLSMLFLFMTTLASAASLEERAAAAFAHVPLRAEQKAPYEDIIRDYYQKMNDMLKRASWQNSGEMLQKLVEKRSVKISDDTIDKMSKVLDDKQLGEFRYALGLANRSFIESIATY